jgi:hypothetical protein
MSGDGTPGACLMFGFAAGDAPLDTVAHIIQVALTPVFLLSGIATLLNVFSTRLARVGDQVEAVGKLLECSDPGEAQVLADRLIHLHRRSVALDVAVLLGAVGGAATCGAVLVLFVGAVREEAVAWALFGLFGLAVVCALGAITAFTFEMLLAGTGIRAEVVQSRRAIDDDATDGDDDSRGESNTATASAASST